MSTTPTPEGSRIRRRLTILLATGLFAIVAMGQEDCAAPTEDTPLDQGDGTAQEEEPETAEPDGQYNLTCDYLLGDHTESESGYKFVAGGTLENTGGGDIRVKVTYEWNLLGQDPVTVEKTYKVREGETRDVNVTELATQDQIDAHQSADAKCDTEAEIVGTT